MYDGDITQFLRLVPWIVHKMTIYPMTTQEAIDEGYVGLLKARRDWSPEKGSQFASYATMRIKYHIMDYRRQFVGRTERQGQAKHAIVHSIERLQEMNEGNWDVADPSVEIEYYGDMIEQLRKYFPELDSRQQRILYLFYFEEMTLDSIAKKLGISPSLCGRIHRRALGVLRVRLQVAA